MIEEGKDRSEVGLFARSKIQNAHQMDPLHLDKAPKPQLYQKG